MRRTKGATNKQTGQLPHCSTLPTEERIEFIASLIVDRILEDQQRGNMLLKKVDRQKYARPTPA